MWVRYQNRDLMSCVDIFIHFRYHDREVLPVKSCKAPACREGELLDEKPWFATTPKCIRGGAIAATINAHSVLQVKAALARSRGEASAQNEELEIR